MPRKLLLCLPLLALAACSQRPSPSDRDAVPATASPAAPMPVPAVPSVPSMSTQLANGTQADAAGGEHQTLMVTSTSGSIDCDGHNLDIVGRDAKLLLRGHCAMIALLGQNGSLQIEQADSLRVVGKDAQVVTTSNIRNVELFGAHGNLQMGRIENLTVMGQENQLSAVSINLVTLYGHRNEIAQQSGTAQVHDYGKDNRVLVDIRQAQVLTKISTRRFN